MTTDAATLGHRLAACIEEARRCGDVVSRHLGAVSYTPYRCLDDWRRLHQAVEELEAILADALHVAEELRRLRRAGRRGRTARLGG